MKIKIRQIGNSRGIILDKQLLGLLNLTDANFVNAKLVNGKLVLSKGRG